MALFRVDFQGSIYGIEQFQHGHHVTSAGPAATVAADAATHWLTQLAVTSFAQNFRTDVQWSQVNVSELGLTPADPIVASAQAAISDGGTATTASLPLQCSVCVSLRTPTAGSRARGRMFLPPVITNSVTNAGRLTSTVYNNLADALQDYFTAMDASLHTAVVVSAASGAYASYSIEDIRVGDVIDTQRRRRNGVAELYATRAV